MANETKLTARWYEVLEPSYIGDQLRSPGDLVQFSGEAGRNLRELSDEELKKKGLA
ncbi:hypothetical protein [Azotobacter vinelandii]